MKNVSLSSFGGVFLLLENEERVWNTFCRGKKLIPSCARVLVGWFDWNAKICEDDGRKKINKLLFKFALDSFWFYLEKFLRGFFTKISAECATRNARFTCKPVSFSTLASRYRRDILCCGIDRRLLKWKIETWEDCKRLWFHFCLPNGIETRTKERFQVIFRFVKDQMK